ncbi:MAG: hypothetical protein J0L92_04490 [Deltaproteobacteria bacterium]|nr:hypothetical protein [Deltaproteobacteria bacterium]
MSVRVRLEHWPLVVIVVDESLERHELPELERQIDAVYARKERFATLADGSRVARMPDASTRKRLAEWQNETRGSIARYNVLSATVVTSSLVRGAMTAMNWIFQPPNRQITVATFAEALAACLDALRAEGLTLPAGLEQPSRPLPQKARDLFAD